MAFRLRTTMAATHGLIAVITIILVVIVSYILINQRFLTYVSLNQQNEHQVLIKSFSSAKQAGAWDQEVLHKKGIKALKQGYLVTVKNNTGKAIWQPQMVDKETYQEALTKVQERITSHFGIFHPSLQTKSYQLSDSQEVLGSIELSYYTIYFLTDHDLMFLSYLNTSLLWIGGLSFLFALLLSTIISNKISNQLARIINTAKDIAKGRNDNKSELTQSQIIEIQELGETLKQLDENLKEKEASSKRLSADIAHELRTPLSTLQSHLEALMEGIWQPTQDRLISCHEEIVRMAALVRDLEQLNKYDTAKIKLITHKFDLCELAKNICTNFQSDFAKKNIELKFLGTTCTLVGDREKLGQVLVNLLSNSLKYTQEEGKVFLNINQDNNFVYIVINDNGIGIAKQDLPNIFNRLYRADVSRTRATGGAGIGLAVAKAIVEAHKGQIGVVSQEGKGTELSVIIPKEEPKI